jgi:hypothetical protein
MPKKNVSYLKIGIWDFMAHTLLTKYAIHIEVERLHF